MNRFDRAKQAHKMCVQVLQVPNKTNYRNNIWQYKMILPHIFNTKLIYFNLLVQDSVIKM